MLKKIAEMETEISALTDDNRELNSNGNELEQKFYHLLEEKLTNDNELQETANENANEIERLKMEINEISQDNEMKEEILRCLRKQVEDLSEKTQNKNNKNDEISNDAHGLNNDNFIKKKSSADIAKNLSVENFNKDKDTNKKIEASKSNEKINKIPSIEHKSSNNESEFEDNNNKSYSLQAKKSKS